MILYKILLAQKEKKEAWISTKGSFYNTGWALWDAGFHWAFSYYRVFNYGWLVLNRWCASHGHHFVFFFPPSVYCLTFFVSKFQGSMSTSLSVALIWSISCIHGFDWKSWLFINAFFFKFLSFQNGLSYGCEIGLKLKMIWCSFLQLPWSVCQ